MKRKEYNPIKDMLIELIVRQYKTGKSYVDIIKEMNAEYEIQRKEYKERYPYEFEN